MSAAPKLVPAAKFKAECLALLERVATMGEALIVTKRGRPVAKVVPVDAPKASSLLRSVKQHGDIVGPTGERWDAEP